MATDTKPLFDALRKQHSEAKIQGQQRREQRHHGEAMNRAWGRASCFSAADVPDGGDYHEHYAAALCELGTLLKSQGWAPWLKDLKTDDDPVAAIAVGILKSACRGAKKTIVKRLAELEAVPALNAFSIRIEIIHGILYARSYAKLDVEGEDAPPDESSERRDHVEVICEHEPHHDDPGGAGETHAEPDAAETPDNVQWSKADTPTRWAKVFGFSARTLKRRMKDGSIRVKVLSRRSYQIDVRHLPAGDNAPKAGHK